MVLMGVGDNSLEVIALQGNPSPSYAVSLVIRDHTVLPATWHKWTHPALTRARQAGSRYSIYLPQRDGRLSWPRWLVTYWVGLPVCRQSPIQGVTWPGIEQLCGCRVLLTVYWRVIRDCTWAGETGELASQHCSSVTSEYSAHHRTNCNTGPAPTEPGCQRQRGTTAHAGK